MPGASTVLQDGDQDGGCVLNRDCEWERVVRPPGEVFQAGGAASAEALRRKSAGRVEGERSPVGQEQSEEVWTRDENGEEATQWHWRLHSPGQIFRNFAS